MPKKNLTFEEALAALEGLVSALEKGEMPLEESLKAYEKGVSLSAACEKSIREAKLKLSELGPVKEEPEIPEEAEDDAFLF